MKIVKLSINEEEGLQASEAMKIVEISRNLNATVTVCTDQKCADGLSILELLLLNAQKGSELKLIIEGSDEESALENISLMFTEGAGI